MDGNDFALRQEPMDTDRFLFEMPRIERHLSVGVYTFPLKANRHKIYRSKIQVGKMDMPQMTKQSIISGSSVTVRKRLYSFLPTVFVCVGFYCIYTVYSKCICSVCFLHKSMCLHHGLLKVNSELNCEIDSSV